MKDLTSMLAAVEVVRQAKFPDLSAALVADVLRIEAEHDGSHARARDLVSKRIAQELLAKEQA